MDEKKLGPFTPTPGRIMLVALGVLLVIIAISTSMGGINAYQSLREANAAATSGEATAEGAAEAPPAQ
ncbi:hypothetical protein WH87_01590 [Devosia epidermidihirudinis]|uniref:Uncharacterized protein n=1 Tax=Devosia epidermidihirudinis TaxID=1293439 RepID=A0A0F5QLG7_9HYPH|nr:hypothetical protein [Devosia epidermidihirudinis]KKC40889.1 hypothetical protein WH87_01590 [Devosia epidermidihirudinis]